MDIKAKNSRLCHALRKRSLVTSDIFLFNVGNHRPNIKHLALDRWKIFIIQDNELIDFTSQYTKIKGETTISDEDVGYRTEYNY